MVEIEEKNGINPNVEKLKLFANTSAKGVTTYSWEIQLLNIDIERLDTINKQMVAKYGTKSLVE